MIRKCTDCQYTPPSLRHQDLKPRVNRANYDMGVLCWNPIVELGRCYRKMMESTGLWWWWNISVHIRNRSPDLFQFKYRCFVITKSHANSYSTVKDWQKKRKVICSVERIEYGGSRKMNAPRIERAVEDTHTCIYMLEKAVMWKSCFLFMNLPRAMCMDRLWE